MKQKLLLLALGTISGLWLGAAQAAAPSPQFLGTWELDTPKPSAGGAAPPQSGLANTIPMPVRVTIKDAGGGKWSSQATLEMADGSRRTQPAVLFTLDGTASPLSGDLTLAVVFADPRTATATVVDHGLPVSTETSTLSADGKHLAYVLDTTGPDGTPIHVSETFHKTT